MDIVEAISPAEERFEKIRKTIGLILGPAIFILIYIFPIRSIPPVANHLAAILFLVIIWWITEPIPIPVTALLGPCLAVLCGVDSIKKVFTPFADPVVFLFIGSFILAEAMSNHKLDRRIAYAILSVKIIGNSTRKILFFYGLIALIVSMWISNTATTAMLLPIGIGILNALTHIYQEKTKDATANVKVNMKMKNIHYSTALMLMAAYGASVGGLGTPVGTPPNLIGIGLISKLLNIRISFFQWMVMALPIVIVMYVVLFLLLSFLHPSEIKNIEGVNEYIIKKKNELGKISAGERNVLIAFVVTVLLWILPGFIVIFSGGGSETIIGKWYETHVPEAAAAIIGATLLFVMPTNWSKREFTITWQDATKIDWGTILLFGGGLALGTLMFSTGLADTLGRWLFSITGAKSYATITALSIALGIIISEFTSNTASANMVIPVMISLAQTAGINPLGPAIGACMGASYGFMLPVSTPPNAIVYGSGLVPIRKMVRAGLIFDICGFIIILIGMLVYLPLLGIK